MLKDNIRVYESVFSLFAQKTKEPVEKNLYGAFVKKKNWKNNPLYFYLNNKKKIIVSAESDICTFAARTVHFKSSNEPAKSLFTASTRPKALTELYDAAVVVAVRSLDALRRQDGSSMDMFLCTPVLGKRKKLLQRDQSLDIESRKVMPSAALKPTFYTHKGLFFLFFILVVTRENQGGTSCLLVKIWVYTS